MYELLKISGLLFRQFLLPNPFEAICSNYAFILNILLGALLLPISYAIVGSFYKRHRDGAAFGSFMFNVVYIGLTLIIWGLLELIKLISDNWVIAIVFVGVVTVIVVVQIIIKVYSVRHQSNKHR